MSTIIGISSVAINCMFRLLAYFSSQNDWVSAIRKDILQLFKSYPRFYSFGTRKMEDRRSC